MQAGNRQLYQLEDQMVERAQPGFNFVYRDLLDIFWLS
jgi:hypothetical protein